MQGEQAQKLQKEGAGSVQRAKKRQLGLQPSGQGKSEVKQVPDCRASQSVVWLLQVKCQWPALMYDSGDPEKQKDRRFVLQLELAGLADGRDVEIQKGGTEANSQVNGGALNEMKTWVWGHTGS